MAEGSAKGFRLWRLLTITGLLIGIGSLFRDKIELVEPEAVRARGRHTAWPSAESLKAKHEVNDLDVRATVWILVGIAATVAFTVGIVFVMVWRFNVQRDASFARLPPQQTALIVPPAPHLAKLPFNLLVRNQVREQHLLHSYGWTSADHSTARIPIGRAMALTVGTSLDTAP